MSSQDLIVKTCATGLARTECMKLKSTHTKHTITFINWHFMWTSASNSGFLQSVTWGAFISAHRDGNVANWPTQWHSLEVCKRTARGAEYSACCSKEYNH